MIRSNFNATTIITTLISTVAIAISRHYSKQIKTFISSIIHYSSYSYSSDFHSKKEFINEYSPNS